MQTAALAESLPSESNQSEPGPGQAIQLSNYIRLQEDQKPASNDGNQSEISEDLIRNILENQEQERKNIKKLLPESNDGQMN